MCCKNFWKRLISFAIALAIGLLAANILQRKNIASEDVKPAKNIIYEESKCHYVLCNGIGQSISTNKTENSTAVTKLRITSQPHPNYTESARLNNAQGSVTLRVTFLANGTIGDVSPVTELSYGLTEQCILAAKQIKFEPMIENGRAKSVTKVVEYRFTIY